MCLTSLIKVIIIIITITITITIIIVIINYFIIIATICYKKAQFTNVFIWWKMFIGHCVIQAALAIKFYSTLERRTLIGQGERKIIKIAYPFVKVLFKFTSLE